MNPSREVKIDRALRDIQSINEHCKKKVEGDSNCNLVIICKSENIKILSEISECEIETGVWKIWKSSMKDNDISSKDSEVARKIISIFLSILENNLIHKICLGTDTLLRMCGNNNMWIHSSFDDLGVMAYSLSSRYKNISNLSELFANDIASEISIPKHRDWILSEFSKDISTESIEYARGIGLYFAFHDELTIRKNSFYRDYDMPLMFILRDIEQCGMGIDLDILDNLSKHFLEKMQDYEEKIFEISGYKVNIASPKQVATLLFEKMQLHKRILDSMSQDTSSDKKNTADNVKFDGKSTNAEVLEVIAGFGFNIAQYILDWRKFAKLNNTYIEGLKKAGVRNDCDPLDEGGDDITILHRIHCKLHEVSTSTRRLSASDPNLQSIPVATSEGAQIRAAFVAKDRHTLIIADYSQIELRLLAHIGKVSKFVQLLQNNEDIHRITASEIFGVREKDVSDEMRRSAKTVNFGIIYGMSAFGLAQRLHIHVSDAHRYIANYFRIYPEIQQYILNIVEFAQNHGYVETIFGNRCYIENIRSRNKMLKKMAERSAINAPLQGSAADIARVAIVKTPLHLRDKIIMQIHDELIFEVDESEAESYAREIADVMENVTNIHVPLRVNIRINKSWGGGTAFAPSKN